jgi:serine/threonine protein kinase
VDSPSLRRAGFTPQLWHRILIQDTQAGMEGVWLARDMRWAHIISSCLFHFLISSSAASTSCLCRCQNTVYSCDRLVNELDILQRINTHESLPWSQTYRRHFTVTDRHGPHLCLVFEALGAVLSILLFINNSWSKSACPFLKDIARQLLGALDVLHRECRIIHTARIVVASVAAV